MFYDANYSYGRLLFYGSVYERGWIRPKCGNEMPKTPLGDKTTHLWDPQSIRRLYTGMLAVCVCVRVRRATGRQYSEHLHKCLRKLHLRTFVLPFSDSGSIESVHLMMAVKTLRIHGADRARHREGSSTIDYYAWIKKRFILYIKY